MHRFSATSCRSNSNWKKSSSVYTSETGKRGARINRREKQLQAIQKGWIAIRELKTKTQRGETGSTPNRRLLNLEKMFFLFLHCPYLHDSFRLRWRPDDSSSKKILSKSSHLARRTIFKAIRLRWWQERFYFDSSQRSVFCRRVKECQHLSSLDKKPDSWHYSPPSSKPSYVSCSFDFLSSGCNWTRTSLFFL